MVNQNTAIKELILRGIGNLVRNLNTAMGPLYWYGLTLKHSMDKKSHTQ